uniref:Uncharacterized protein n=1 Tax=Plectus sambesii TaxID=2011161 RepID=A0A914WDW8_9BILA
MAEFDKSSLEYNRRAAIVESLHTGRTPTEIIRFFGYPRSTVYDIAKRHAVSEESEKDSSTPARKIRVREESIRTLGVIQRAQYLIFENPGTSLGKLAAVLGVDQWWIGPEGSGASVDGGCGLWETVHLPTRRRTRSHESFNPKLATCGAWSRHKPISPDTPTSPPSGPPSRQRLRPWTATI